MFLFYMNSSIVDTFGEMIQAGKYNNIDFEMMEDLNIEWPVKSPGSAIFLNQ